MRRALRARGRGSSAGGWRPGLCGLAIALLIQCSALSERRKMDAAEASALQWLARLDEGRYEECWDQASVQLRERTPKDKWINSTSLARRSLERPGSRKVYEHKYRTRLGQGPEGQYVNFTCGASSHDGRTFGELMTMVLDPDGVWRVYGYRVVGAQASQ